MQMTDLDKEEEIAQLGEKTFISRVELIKY